MSHLELSLHPSFFLSTLGTMNLFIHCYSLQKETSLPKAKITFIYV